MSEEKKEKKELRLHVDSVRVIDHEELERVTGAQLHKVTGYCTWDYSTATCMTGCPEPWGTLAC